MAQDKIIEQRQSAVGQIMGKAHGFRFGNIGIECRKSFLRLSGKRFPEFQSGRTLGVSQRQHREAVGTCRLRQQFRRDGIAVVGSIALMVQLLGTGVQPVAFK